jgi:hypothetical protein
MAVGMTVSHAECTHLPYALEHTRLSLNDSNAMTSQGTPVLMSNLSNALEHAKASEKAEKNIHTEKAVSDLEAAINLAKAGKGNECHMQIESALKHLELAGQCPK